MSKQKHNFCEFCQKYLNYIHNYPSRNKIRESWKFEPLYSVVHLGLQIAQNRRVVSS